MAEEVRERRLSARRKARHPSRILYKTSFAEAGQSSAEFTGPTLLGHTRDVSERGLALVIPCLRESDYNFYGIEGEIQITLSTPHGVIDAPAEAVRFEWRDVLRH
jgi:hypothetical protein